MLSYYVTCFFRLLCFYWVASLCRFRLHWQGILVKWQQPGLSTVRDRWWRAAPTEQWGSGTSSEQHVRVTNTIYMICIHIEISSASVLNGILACRELTVLIQYLIHLGCFTLSLCIIQASKPLKCSPSVVMLCAQSTSSSAAITTEKYAFGTAGKTFNIVNVFLQFWPA